MRWTLTAIPLQMLCRRTLLVCTCYRFLPTHYRLHRDYCHRCCDDAARDYQRVAALGARVLVFSTETFVPRHAEAPDSSMLSIGRQRQPRFANTLGSHGHGI